VELDPERRCRECWRIAGLICRRCGTPAPHLARFCPSCGQRLAGAQAARMRTGPGRSDVERRQLIVLFCDLVSSTALATSMDAEDFTDLIRKFQAVVADTIVEFGGVVSRFMGDGALTFFGYPQAHEDDAERAVRAALAIVEGIESIGPPGLQLRARAGIASGPVVVGMLVKDVGFSNVDAAGAAPNVASRLQAMAEPGTVLIDDQIRRMTSRAFECRDLGPCAVRGLNEAIRVWQPLRPIPDVSRFAARFYQSSAPLVGRDAEIVRLREIWEEARGGRGRVALLTGEPGIGKSRIVAQLLYDTAGQEAAYVQMFCTPLGRSVSLSPCIHFLEGLAGFDSGDTSDTRLRKLMAALEGADSSSIALLADLLGLQAESGLPDLQLAPHRKKQRLLDALVRLLLHRAENRPVLAVFEDAHWSDPTSLELLADTVERLDGLPVMLIVTGRPEFDPPWRTRPQVVPISLPPLQAADCAALVRSISGPALPDETVDEIIRRADGVPLYAEEMTKAMVEAGLPRAGSGGIAAPELPTSVPPSLHASLVARLDRLGGARDLLETAAAIGRHFDARLLSVLGGRAQAGLQQSLGRLARLGLVEHAGDPHRGLYRFRHALIRDAAYGLIVRERRRGLHRRIAEAIEHDAPEVAANEPHILAYHWTEAADVERATGWWLRAGVHAMRRSMMSDAIAQVQRGIDLLQTLPPGEFRQRREVELLVVLGKALLASKGHAAPVVGETFERAHALCRDLGAVTALPTILFCEWTRALLRAELDIAEERAAELAGLSRKTGDPVLLVIAHFADGVSRLPRGDFQGAMAALGRALALFEPAKRESYAALVVGDARVVMRTYLSRARLCVGDLDGARRSAEDGLGEARRLGHVYTICHALFQKGYVTANVASPAEALGEFEELRTLAHEHGIAFFEACGTIMAGWCLCLIGAHRNGWPLLSGGIAAYRSSGCKLYVPSFLRFEAEALALDGRRDEALERLDQAQAEIAATSARWDAPEMARIRGGILAAAGDHEGASTAFLEAIRQARASGARLFELRAAMDLADLELRRAGPSRARDAFMPAYSGFPGGGASADVARARELATRVEDGVA
jgi:class 3 adenylate cyclase/predicted ATPase